MHDGMPYGRNQGQGQGHSREVDHQSPTGLIFCYIIIRNGQNHEPNTNPNPSHNPKSLMLPNKPISRTKCYHTV